MPGSIPAVGTAGTGYATQINLFLTEVKTRMEEKIPLTSLQAGTLDLSNNPLLNAQYLGIYTQASSPTTPTNSLQQYGGDLWWISGGASPVQITSGASLNAAALAGITGDYGGGNPAQFRYVTANTEYTAYTNFGAGTYAYLWALGIDFASASTGSNRIRMVSSGTSNYTTTLPTALPAATTTMTMTSGGQMGFASSVTRTLNIPTSAGHLTGSPSTILYNVVNFQMPTNSANDGIAFPIVLNTGDTITGFTVTAAKSSNASNTLTARLEKSIANTGTILESATNNSNAPGAITLTPGAISHTIASNEQWFIRCFQSSSTASAADQFYEVFVTYTRAI